MSMKEYVQLKRTCERVRDQKIRKLDRWKIEYEPYYEGEEEVLYDQYYTEILREFTDRISLLKEMFLSHN